MMGSGTTLLEAQMAGRKPLGFDIDPLAARIAQAKLIPPDLQQSVEWTERIIEQAQQRMQDSSALQTAFEAAFWLACTVLESLSGSLIVINA
jgi:hypothetical protein